MNKEKQYSMFYPETERELSADYPELRENETFRRLNRSEQLFVWYYGCKASPFYMIDNIDEKIKKCIAKSYGSLMKHNQKEKYYAGVFPQKIKDAIEFIEKFELSPRIKAKLLTEKMMDNIKKIIDINVEDQSQFLNKDDEVDWSKKKAYIDSCEKATKMMPELIRQSEEAFGVKSIMSKSSDKEDGDFMSNFYDDDEN